MVKQLIDAYPTAPLISADFYRIVPAKADETGLVARRAFGDFGCFLVWNPSDVPAQMRTALRPLDALSARFHVFSFWDERYLGVLGSDFETEALPPHGGLLMRFTPVREDGLPVLIGSTLHAAMGAAEITDFRAGEDFIEIDLNEAGTADGRLFIACGAPFTVAQSDGCKADAAYTGGLLVVSLRERVRAQRIVLRAQHDALRLEERSESNRT